MRSLQAHQEALTAVGSKAHLAATEVHRYGRAQRRDTAGAAMQLRYMSIPHLIAEAGGDPWAIDKSLQAGRPAQISDLAQAFHDAVGVRPSPALHSTRRVAALRRPGIGRTAITRSTTPPKCSG